MKSQTLNTAVLNAIQALRTVGSPFSAHDVTTIIRQAVNSRVYTLTDVAVVGVQFRNRQVQNIPHEVVRAEIIKLYNTGVLANVFGITRKDTGTYMEYSFPVGTGMAATVQAFTKKPLTSSVPSAFFGGTSTSKRIEKYIVSKGSRTLKQVQSALYPTKLSCDNIAKLVQNIPTLALSRSSDLSKSIVLPI